jgi:hypothetical protein
MKHIGVLFLLLGQTLCLRAQTKVFFLEGRVQARNGEALAGVSIQCDEGPLGATDSLGRFSLEADFRPRSLTARSLGYFPQRIRTDTFPWINQRIQVQFALTPVDISLPEVTISSVPVRSVFEEDFSTDLLDYQFAGADLLLLVKEKKKYFVRMTTDEGGIISEIQLPGDNLSILHQSCTGAWHAVGKNWGWEITYQNNRLDTFPRYPAYRFHQTVKPCAARSNGYYFVYRMSAFKHAMEYYYLPPGGGKGLLLHIEDSLAERTAYQLYQDFIMKRPYMLPKTFEMGSGNAFSTVAHPEFGNSADQSVEAEQQAFELSTLMRYLDVYDNNQLASLGALQSLRNDSLYAPMFALGDKVWLFNHPGRDLMEINTANWQVRHLPLRYQLEKFWSKDVLMDVSTRRAYGRFTHPTTGCILKEINLETGATGRQYNLYPVPYLSEKYKMRNGTLFYIGQPDVNTPNKRLYRAELHAFLTNK